MNGSFVHGQKTQNTQGGLAQGRVLAQLGTLDTRHVHCSQSTSFSHTNACTQNPPPLPGGPLLTADDDTQSRHTNTPAANTQESVPGNTYSTQLVHLLDLLTVGIAILSKVALYELQQEDKTGG